MSGPEEVFWGLLFALVPFSSLIRHLPPSLPSTAEGPAGSFHDVHGTSLRCLVG